MRPMEIDMADITHADYDQTGGSHVFDYYTWKWMIHWQKEGRWTEAQILDWTTTFWVKEGYYEQ